MNTNRFSFLNFFRKQFWFIIYFYLKGTIRMSNHDYDKAKKYFQKCLEFDLPINFFGLIFEQLGKCYIDTGEINKGKMCLLKSLEIDSKQAMVNSEVSSRLGFIYFQEGNYEKAIYHLENAIKNYKKFHYTDIEHAKEYLEKAREKIQKNSGDTILN